MSRDFATQTLSLTLASGSAVDDLLVSHVPHGERRGCEKTRKDNE
jgi:hypothetical protein